MRVPLTDADSILRLRALAPASGFQACPACAGTMAGHSEFCPLLNADPRPDDDNPLIAARIWHQLAAGGNRPLADAIEVATYLLAQAAEQEGEGDRVRQVVQYYVCDRIQMIRLAKMMASRGQPCSLNPDPPVP